MTTNEEPAMPVVFRCLTLPLPKSLSRMETGVVRFGDDWPGVFLRGDCAAHMAGYLREALAVAKKLDPITRIVLENFCESLESADPGGLPIESVEA